MPSKQAVEKNEREGEGRLFIIATPIGNLSDITLRALETLRAVDLVAAEDTRHTRKLLSYYDIHKPLISYHEHNARQRGIELLEKVREGQKIGIVTDAGTPGISDPGMLLIEAALEQGIEPVPIPGPTALITALIASGLSTHPFAFLGFAPARGTERKRFFEKYKALEMTCILYESPKRLARTLQDITDTWGDRRIAVARELTKIHEEIFRGTVSGAMKHFENEPKGELTLVVEGSTKESLQAEPVNWEDELRSLLEQGISSKEAASTIAGRFNLPRRLVYQTALRMKKDIEDR